MRRGVRTVEVEGTQEIDGRDIDYTATVRVMYQPAQLYGPPEKCYPDESETDIESSFTFPPGYESKLDTEEIEDKAWEEFLTGGDS